MNKIKRLIVFGCSYCTGEEILYHELGDELSYLHKITHSDPRIFFKKIEKEGLEYKLKEIQSRQIDLAWPKKLADLLGIECVNLAESGNSMQKMLWQFLDYIRLNEVFDTDLILFAQTKSERSLYFREFPMSFQVSTVNDPGLNRILGVSKNGGVCKVIDEKLDEAIMQWFNDDRLVWDYIMILTCLNYWKQKYNLFIVPAMSLNQLTLQEYNKNLFDSLIKNFTDSDLYLTRKELDHYKNKDDDYLPWGHPKETIHSQYAQHLSEVINDRFQI
jgi:hypothetical protein